MNKRRDNFIEFIYYNFENIKNQIFPFLGLVLSLVGAKNHYIPYIKFGFYLLISLIIIYSFLKWSNKTFEFNNDMIRISEGVFRKRNNDIPYNRVKSINTSDSLLKRAFGIANFSIELIGGKKVFFVLKHKEINELKEQLFQGVHIDNGKTEKNKLKPKEYFLLSLTNHSVFFAAFSLSTTLFSFAIKHFGERLGLKNNNTEKSGKELVESWNNTELLSFDFLFPSILLFSGMIFLSYLISFVYIYLTYGNFKTTSNETDIQIQYGIINKKNYHIPKKQIRSLRIIEPLIFRLFGFVQLKVDNIGLNEQNSSSVLLHPIIKKELTQNVLDNHISNFELQPIKHKPETKSLIYFLFKPTFNFLIFTMLLLVFSSKWIYLLILLPLPILSGYTKWKHSGLSFNDKFTTIRKTIRLKSITIVTFKKYTETTKTKQSFLMEKQELMHYRFSVYSEKKYETYECRYMKNTSKQEFLNYI